MMYKELILKFLLLSIIVTTASADDCTGLFIDKQYYNVNIIKEGLTKIHEIAFNHKDNTVYFTFDQKEKVPERSLGYLKLDNEEAGIIDEVKNATGLYIDQDINRLYVGGPEGIFMFNLNDNRTSEGIIVKDDIKSIFLKNSVVYYVNGKKVAYKYEFGAVSPVYELVNIPVDKVVVDGYDNVFYLQNNKLFSVKMGSKIVNPYDKFTVNDINVNLKSKLYICAKDGLYFYIKNRGLEKVSDNLRDIRKITFVNDDPLYVVVDKLVRLTKDPVPCLGD